MGWYRTPCRTAHLMGYQSTVIHSLSLLKSQRHPAKQLPTGSWPHYIPILGHFTKSLCRWDPTPPTPTKCCSCPHPLPISALAERMQRWLIKNYQSEETWSLYDHSLKTCALHDLGLYLLAVTNFFKLPYGWNVSEWMHAVERKGRYAGTDRYHFWRLQGQALAGPPCTSLAALTEAVTDRITWKTSFRSTEYVTPTTDDFGIQLKYKSYNFAIEIDSGWERERKRERSGSDTPVFTSPTFVLDIISAPSENDVTPYPLP